MASAARVLRRTEKLVLPAALAIALTALAAWLIFRPAPPSGITASGTIEVVQSDVAPKVQGRLIALKVRDGQAVRKGQILAVLEQTNPALNLEQARAVLAAATASAASAQAAYDLQLRTYETQLQQASAGVAIAGAGIGQASETLAFETQSTLAQIDRSRAQLQAAQAAFDRAQIQYARMKALAASGDEPQQLLDDATMQYRDAEAQLKSARDALAIAQESRRNVRIKEYALHASRSQQAQSESALSAARAESALIEQRRAQLLNARAQIQQAQAAEHLAQNQVDETRVAAPYDGYVVSHNFEAGDLLSPGSALMTIADVRHPYVYVYVPETLLPKIKTGTRADVRIDALANRTFSGTVTEIGTTAEFTPENVQTAQERIDYLVFRVRIQLDDTTGELKAGLPADATIHV